MVPHLLGFLAKSSAEMMADCERKGLIQALAKDEIKGDEHD